MLGLYCTSCLLSHVCLGVRNQGSRTSLACKVTMLQDRSAFMHSMAICVQTVASTQPVFHVSAILQIVALRCQTHCVVATVCTQCWKCGVQPVPEHQCTHLDASVLNARFPYDLHTATLKQFALRTIALCCARARPQFCCIVHHFCSAEGSHENCLHCTGSNIQASLDRSWAAIVITGVR